LRRPCPEGIVPGRSIASGREADPEVRVSDGERPTIRPKPDGPLFVTNLKRLANRNGPIETKPTMALCRCGKSSKKPFCDGTHKTIGFTTAKSENRVRDRRDEYAGERITIHDNRGICAHAGHCTDELPAVFRMRQKPWIDPNAASPEEITAIVRKCPSGALSLATQLETDEAEPAIFVAPDGPYVVTGNPELLETELGQGASLGRFTLCRCGQSRNKPFCDGSHWSAEFVDDDN
jgi:CDGSH-type Zn-finger protein